MEPIIDVQKPIVPWNKGRLVGQKLPLKLRKIWAIRIRLQLSERLRDLALFNLATPRVWPSPTAGERYRAGPKYFSPCHSHAAEDATACSVRDH